MRGIKHALFSAILLINLLLINSAAASSQTVPQNSLKARAAFHWQNTLDYWKPRATNLFLDDIQPALIKSYSWYLENYQDSVDKMFWTSLDYLTPVNEYRKESVEYIKYNHAVTYYFIADIPAVIKRSYEFGIIKIWQQLYNMSNDEKALIDKKHLMAAEMAMAAGHSLKRDSLSPAEKHLNRIIGQIKYHTRDKGMQSCYRAVVFDFDIENAFNIGCNIFFGKPLYEMLKDNDDQLRAVLAHEMAHGDRGHGMKTLGSLIATGATHSAQLVLEEMAWALQGGQRDFLDEVIQRGNMDMIMEAFSEKAPQIEIDADMHATRILLNAGYSPQALIDFLASMHSEKALEECDSAENIKSKSGGRNYPSLCKRIDAIHSAWEL